MPRSKARIFTVREAILLEPFTFLVEAVGPGVRPGSSP